MLNAFASLKCSKTCQHDAQKACLSLLAVYKTSWYLSND